MIGDRAWSEGALARLISTSSLSGQEAAAQQCVEQMMREAGADAVRRVFVDAAALRDAYGFETPTPTEGMFAVVGEWGGRAASPFVLLNGHVDTVPATHGWAIDPLEPRITEGWMNGLGSADMKSGLVGAIAGVARAKATGKLRGNVEIQSVPDEETGGGTGTLACVHELLTEGRIPGFAIVCEPTSVEIATSQIGSRAMYYSVHGVQAHANMKHKGVSAVEAGDRAGSRPGELGEHARPQSASSAGPGFGQHRTHRGRIGATSVSASCSLKCASPTIRPTRPF